MTVAAQVPVANFTATPVAGCSPLLVKFNDMSGGNPTSWFWDFGNGNTSTASSPSASYLTSGKYTVSLTVKNASGSNTLTRSQLIEVYETPTVSFAASRTNGCFPLNVQFTDNSTAGAGNTNTGWFWDFGDGNISTEQHPFHTYTLAGSFTVTLEVTNDKGCRRVLTVPNSVQVLAGLSSGFSNTQPAVCQPPAAVTFTNTSTGPGTLSYQWNFGDGNTSTDINPGHTYTVKGLYDVSLVVISSTGCTDTLVKKSLIPVGAYNPSFSSPDTVCIASPVSFQNTSMPEPTGFNWTFGDASTPSTDANPVKAYSTANTYTVKMVANYGSCSDSVTRTIVVLPKPVPAFTAPVVNSCQPPLTVSFQNQSVNGATWLWKFGDGNTSTDPNPVHTYTAYGNYNVTLVVTNSFGCIDSLTKAAFVKIAKPVLAIPTLPAQGCIPYTLSPVANITTVDAVTSYAWDFGDGGTSNSPTPTHVYPTQGTYNVRLIITTSTGCTDTLLANNGVRVGTLPTANFSASPIPVCAADIVQFTDLSSTSDQWYWDFGDGTNSSEQNPQHKYKLTGPFTITLQAINSGCPDPEVKTNYVVVRPPIAAFDIVPNCANRFQFSFVNQSTKPTTTWLWDFGDGTTSNVQAPTHIFPALGAYNVTLTATNVYGPGDECDYSLTQTLHVINENPDITIAAPSGCKGTPINFHSVVSNPLNISNYYMDFGDGATVHSDVPDILHTYTRTGLFPVMLIITDVNGCKDTVIKTNFIRINGPTAKFTATNPTGCQNLITTFNDQSRTDGINAITNWQWDFGDGTVQDFAAAPFQHTYANVGTYSVKLKLTDAVGCSDTISATDLIVITDPVPGFSTRDTLSCPGATVTFSDSSVGLNYSTVWYFGDGSFSATPSHVYTRTGIYNVKLRITDQFGCQDSAITNAYVRIDRPVAAFTLSDSISSCTPFKVDFRDTSTYYSSLLWNFGEGGPSNQTDPKHYYGIPGTFKVSLIATSPGGCTDTAYKTVAVYDTAGSFIKYIPLEGCSPRPVSFSAFTPGPVTYLWDFGDGITDTTALPVSNHIFTSFGDYVPRVIMQDPSGCLVPVQGSDTIHITGSKSKFGADHVLLCDNGFVQFTDSTTFNDPVTNWNWDFGDGTTSTDQSPAHKYARPGIYTVSLNTVTLAGCKDPNIRENYIKVVTSPVIGITGDSIACVLTNTTQRGVILRADTSAVSWQWSFPNGQTSAVQNPVPQTYTNAGTFAITAIVTNSSGCSDTAIKNILLNPLPTIDMPGTVTLLSGETIKVPATYSSNSATWQWNPAVGLSCTTCAQPVAGPRVSTTYNVLVIDSNGCRNSQAINIIIVCKDGNIFIPNTFSPNGDGSNDRFYPRGRGLDRIHILRIFNRWGEVVFEKKDFPVNDASYGWDGTFKGKGPLAGVYVFQAEVYCSNGELIKFTGNISLIQ